MKKILILLYLLTVTSFSAQFSLRFQNPKTPEVYQMEKYGNQDINLYTGKPNVNIPLYEVKYGNITIPLSLSYNSNGIKGDEEASRVGLGWYLDLPMISQTVQGYDDLSMQILLPDYFSYYKPYYIVNPQPNYWYEKSSIPGAVTTGPQPDRLNISQGLQANPEQHLNDFFMAKVKSDGIDNYFGVASLYYPRNGQLYNYNLDQKLNNYGEAYDIEMDLFQLNLFGEQIIFYKLPNVNNFYSLNKKNYKMNFELVSNINLHPLYKFTVFDPFGVKYIFEEQVNSNVQNINNTTGFPYFSSNTTLSTPIYTNGYNPLFGDYYLSARQWKLTKIIDLNNNVINLLYKNLPLVTKTYDNAVTGSCDFLKVYPLVADQYDTTHSPYPLKSYSPISLPGQMDGTAGDKVKCYRTNIAAQFSENSILNKIIFGDSEINFNSSNRNDILNDQKIDSINIINKDKIVKNIWFNYSYYPNDHALSKRMKLDELLVNKEVFKFDYNTTNIANSTDYWGYFNGISSQTPFINPFRLYKNSGDIPQWALSLNEQYKNTENKSAHPEYSKIGILKKVTYPTGGYSIFDYELNTFDNYFFPNYDNKITVNKNNFAISHLNIDTNFTNRSTPSFNVNNGDIINGKITLTNGISGSCPYANSSFKIVKIPADWISQYNSGVTGRENFWYVVDNGYITVETIYSKTGFNSLNDFNFSINISSDAILAARVKFDTSCPTTGSPKGIITANFGSSKYNDYNQLFSSGYGLRVKSISDYNENGLVSQKQYQYFGGKHIPPYKPINDLDKYYLYSYNRNFATGEDTTYLNDEIRSSTGEKITSYSSPIFQTNFLGNGDFVGYDKVIVNEVANNTSKGKTEYYFFNSPDKRPNFGIADGISPFEMDKFGFSVRTNETKNGSLLKKEIFTANGQLLRKDSMTYNNNIFYNSISSYNVKVLNAGISGNLISRPSMPPERPNFYTFSNYYFYYYPLKGIETLLNTSYITEYLDGKKLENKTDYLYNEHNLLNQKSILTSAADQITENYSYSNLIPKLKNANILSENIGKNIFKNGKQVLNKAIKYDNANHYNPTSIVTYELNSPNVNIPNDITYDQYDSKGNLLQYTGKDGVSTTIIWGYNQTQPIAKITGAKLSDISQSLIDSIVSASTTDNAAAPGSDESAFLSALDNFRKDSSMANYQVTTYTYDPLIGVRSITPPSGIREVYIYDAANRLKEIREDNQSGKLLKEFKYNYKN